MNSFYVFNSSDEKWPEYLLKAKQHDFYHTSCYQELEEEGTPLLFVGEVDSNFIAIPLLLRHVENTAYRDCTSVYGYCGPLSNVEFNEIPDELFVFFRNQMNNYFKDHQIISVFSRLHPLIIGDQVFDDFGIVKDINQTVAINLVLSPEEQRRQYRKSNKSEINQLRKKKGFQVKEAQGIEEIRKFIAIYYETMDRVSASKNYYFNEDYFLRFLENDCFSAKLLLAIKNDKIAAGAIFTVTSQIMQYHLAGTAEDYISDTPMKLILDEARLLGNALNLKYLHLGGGVGGSDEDSLFRFKSGFSKERFVYRTWQYIVDEEKYNEVCRLNSEALGNDGNYFPLYRSAH